MSSPKSGKAGIPVDPAGPKSAEEADKADPGKVEEAKAEQRKTQTGKYGSEKVKPYKPPQTKEEKEKKSWIEIKLMDEEGKPVPGEKYKITLSDNTVIEGTLGEQGFARHDEIPEGNCKVTFPELDGSSWRKA